jgi:hypothetical protein
MRRADGNAAEQGFVTLRKRAAQALVVPADGKRKFERARAECRNGGSEKPHFSQRTREMGHPASEQLTPQDVIRVNLV